MNPTQQIEIMQTRVKALLQVVPNINVFVVRNPEPGTPEQQLLVIAHPEEVVGNPPLGPQLKDKFTQELMREKTAEFSQEYAVWEAKARPVAADLITKARRVLWKSRIHYTPAVRCGWPALVITVK